MLEQEKMMQRSFSPPPAMNYSPPQMLPTQSTTLSNLIDSFNNDRSILDARVVDGPVAQIEIMGERRRSYPPPMREPMIQPEIVVTDPESDDEGMDLSLKRPMPWNQSIATDRESLRRSSGVTNQESRIE